MLSRPRICEKAVMGDKFSQPSPKSRIALLPFHDAFEGFPRLKRHFLRKQHLARIHAARILFESRNHRE